MQDDALAESMLLLMFSVPGNPSLHFRQCGIPAAGDELHDVGIREPGTTCFRIRRLERAQAGAFGFDPVVGFRHRYDPAVRDYTSFDILPMQTPRIPSAKQYWQRQRSGAYSTQSTHRSPAMKG